MHLEQTAALAALHDDVIAPTVLGSVGAITKKNKNKKTPLHNIEVNVTWPVELLPSRHIEHFAVDSHEDPGVLQTVVRLQLCNGEIPLLHLGKPLFRRRDLRRPVAAEDFVDEEEAEAEQGQIERRGEDLQQDPTRS